MTVRVAGVELGGTKSIAMLDVDGITVAQLQFATRTPAETLEALVDQVAAWNSAGPLDALGIASFGPLGLDPDDAAFGRIAATPKPGWSHVDVRGPFAERLTVPIGFDTDVGGAALAEGRWGASQGCSDHIYVTVGTGVGVGIVANGRLVHGGAHPEAGHLRIRRKAGDPFAGVCPFHGDCLEGLVSGPALAARTAMDGSAISDGHPVWSTIAAELAEAMAVLILTLAPERIVLGGGVVLRRAMLVPMIVAQTSLLLAGYSSSSLDVLTRIIVSPGLGDQAGPRGAIALGLAALARG